MRPPRLRAERRPAQLRSTRACVDDRSGGSRRVSATSEAGEANRRNERARTKAAPLLPFRLFFFFFFMHCSKRAVICRRITLTAAVSQHAPRRPTVGCSVEFTYTRRCGKRRQRFLAGRASSLVGIVRHCERDKEAGCDVLT
ncbi:hypothetical protein MRX96_026870 [Rhipicephalus microplus]